MRGQERDQDGKGCETRYIMEMVNLEGKEMQTVEVRAVGLTVGATRPEIVFWSHDISAQRAIYKLRT